MEIESGTSWVKIRKTIKKELGKTLVVEKTTKEIKAKRLSKCYEPCDMLSKHGECMMCGCFVDTKAGCKTYMNPKTLKVEIPYCPLFKWDEKLDKYLHKFYNQKTLKNGIL